MSVIGMEIKGYRKAGKMGNSLGIGIPKEIAKQLKINAGDEFEISANTKTGEISIKPVKKISLVGGLTPDMEEELEDIFQRYETTFKNLKDR